MSILGERIKELGDISYDLASFNRSLNGILLMVKAPDTVIGQVMGDGPFNRARLSGSPDEDIKYGAEVRLSPTGEHDGLWGLFGFVHARADVRS